VFFYYDYFKSVQHKFLKYLSFKEAGIYPPIGVDYDFLCSRFNFTPLKVRRVLDTVTFLFKLFHNKVDCSSLLSGLCISFPQILSRSHRHFHVPRANTNVLNVVHPVYVRGWRVDRPMGEMLTGAESQGGRHLLEESHRVNQLIVDNPIARPTTLIILLRSECVPCLTVLMILVIFMLCHFRVYWLVYRVI
jgi:hypothetical protein